MTEFTETPEVVAVDKGVSSGKQPKAKVKIKRYPTKSQSKTMRRIFGGNLRAARKSKALTQERIAELTGINQGYLSDVEQGKQNIGLDLMDILAHTVGTPLHKLLEP